MTKYSVEIIQRKGESALVEWNDGKQQRGYVPLDVIKEGQVTSSNLKLAIPYGLDWSQITVPVFSTDDLDRLLKQQGIWTQEDAHNNPDKILGILKKLYQLQLSTVLKYTGKEK